MSIEVIQMENPTPTVYGHVDSTSVHSKVSFFSATYRDGWLDCDSDFVVELDITVRCHDKDAFGTVTTGYKLRLKSDLVLSSLEMKRYTATIAKLEKALWKAEENLGSKLTPIQKAVLASQVLFGTKPAYYYLNGKVHNSGEGVNTNIENAISEAKNTCRENYKANIKPVTLKQA